MPRRKFRRIPKYPEEARAAFGVCTPVVDGKKRGKMTGSFDYTGKKLISKKQWDKLVDAEVKRRRGMRTKDWRATIQGDIIM